MSELLITSAAERDYAEALAWYMKQSRMAAERFDAEFVEALNAIASTPERYPHCDDRHRFLLLRKLPYQLIYRRQGEAWAIIAVAHTSRSPRFWDAR